MRKLDAAKIVSGNARIMLLGTLFGWPLQYAYINQYLPLYITSPQIGISKQFYGVLCAITHAVVVTGAIVSGSLAVRLKPKWVLTCGDLCTFVLCSILWLFGSSKYPVIAVIAALCAGAWGFHTASFQLLMTHGQNRETLPRMYALFNITMLGAGLLSPLGGLLLRHFDLIVLTRTFLCVNATLILSAIVFRKLLLEEYVAVKQPAERPTFELWKTIVILRNENRNLLALFGVVFINGFCMIVRFNYANIYYTAGLGISKTAISILPAISSTAAILATLFLSPHFRTSR
jgi:MFS transporter, DHA1 family, tetracycline resistance protein